MKLLKLIVLAALIQGCQPKTESVESRTEREPIQNATDPLSVYKNYRPRTEAENKKLIDSVETIDQALALVARHTTLAVQATRIVAAYKGSITDLCYMQKVNAQGLLSDRFWAEYAMFEKQSSEEPFRSGSSGYGKTMAYQLMSLRIDIHDALVRSCPEVFGATGRTASVATSGSGVLQYDARITLPGKVVGRQTKLPSGSTLTYYVLVLDRAIDVAANSDYPAEGDVKALHLAPSANMDLDALGGASVSVSGQLFHAENANHRTPVVLLASEIKRIRE